MYKVSERQQSLVMLERHIESYGKGIPYLPNTKVKGRLIVIEGPDASGRSAQITMLTSKLEADGHAVLNTGLRRSELISQGILEIPDIITATPTTTITSIITTTTANIITAITIAKLLPQLDI